MMKSVKNLPDDYYEKGSLDLKKDTRALIFLNIAGVVLLVISGWLFFRAVVWLRPAEVNAGLTLRLGTIREALLTILALLVISAVMLLLHEAIHGLFFWLFTGTRPHFGIGPGYAYASAPQWYLPRNLYFMVSLAPLVFISLGGLLLLAVLPPAWFMTILVFITLNASGAIGDLAVAAWLLFQPSTCLARDSGDAVSLYLLK